MQSFRFVACVFAALFAQLAIGAPTYTPATAFVVQEVESGVLNDRCQIDGETRHSLGEMLLVVGVKTCHSTASDSNGRSFYIVLLKDKVVYVPESGILLNPDAKRRLSQLTSDEQDSAIVLARRMQKQAHVDELNELRGRIDLAKSRGLLLVRARAIDISEHTEGTGVEFTVYNPTAKVIKYISLTVAGINAVGDPVRTTRGLANVVIKGVGPVEPGNDATYSFDYVWHTDIVQSLKVLSVKVEYMDRSVKVISKPNEIWLDESQRELWESLGTK